MNSNPLKVIILVTAARIPHVELTMQLHACFFSIRKIIESTAARTGTTNNTIFTLDTDVFSSLYELKLTSDCTGLGS